MIVRCKNSVKHPKQKLNFNLQNTQSCNKGRKNPLITIYA
mgnify:CR=1 FL=1